MSAGVVRDFSEAAKENLIKQIDVINAEQWSPITDAFGDIWYTAGSWLGFLNIENYLGKVDQYHKKVLDQHDTTVNDLGRIFEAVAGVDGEYGVTFSSCRSQLEEESKAIQNLADLINPAMDTFSASNVMSVSESIVDKVEKANEKIDTIYDAELDYAAARAAKNTLFDLGGDILSFAGDLVSLGVNIASGNVVGVVADGWQLINDVVATMEDVTALGLLGLGLCGFQIKGKSKNETREKLLQRAEQAQKIDGVADFLEDQGWNGASKIASVADMASAGYGICKSLKGAGDSVKDVKKYVTDGRYNKTARLTEKALEEAGIATTSVKVKRYENNAKVAKTASKIAEAENAKIHKSGKYVTKSIKAQQAQRAAQMQKNYRELSKQKTAVSNAKTMYKWSKGMIEDGPEGVGKEIFKSSTVGGLVSEGKDVCDDVINLVFAH